MGVATIGRDRASYLGRDRASYLGRKAPPQVHWIFADGGMEPEVYKTVRQKEDFTLEHFKAFRKPLVNAGKPTPCKAC